MIDRFQQPPLLITTQNPHLSHNRALFIDSNPNQFTTDRSYNLNEGQINVMGEDMETAHSQRIH